MSSRRGVTEEVALAQDLKLVREEAVCDLGEECLSRGSGECKCPGAEAGLSHSKEKGRAT